jgi:hypothetical protein
VVISPGDWIWRQLSEPFSALFEGASHLVPTVSWLLLQALFITVLRDEPLHSPSPADFVYLRFFWMPASFLFSSVGPYRLDVITALVYLQFMRGRAPLLSGRVCLTSVSFGSLPLSKHTGDIYATPAFFCRLVYLLPHSLVLWGPHSLCDMASFSIACLLFSFFLFCFVCGQWSVCPGDYVNFSLG